VSTPQVSTVAAANGSAAARERPPRRPCTVSPSHGGGPYRETTLGVRATAKRVHIAGTAEQQIAGTAERQDARTAQRRSAGTEERWSGGSGGSAGRELRERRERRGGRVSVSRTCLSLCRTRGRRVPRSRRAARCGPPGRGAASRPAPSPPRSAAPCR